VDGGVGGVEEEKFAELCSLSHSFTICGRQDK